MYNIAVINFEKKYTFKDELKFRLNKLNQKEFVTIHKIEDKTLKIINIPVTYKTLNNSNRLKKNISLFKRFLNENNIKCILFSDKNNIENILIDYFKEDFFIIKGNTVINYEFYNIIKKYIRINELKDFEIVFYCNDFDLFYNYFKKVYNQFRVEGVITENKIKFKEFAKSIYSDYGIFINIYNEKDFKNSNKYLIINLTDNFIFNNSLDINKINFL